MKKGINILLCLVLVFSLVNVTYANNDGYTDPQFVENPVLNEGPTKFEESGKTKFKVKKSKTDGDISILEEVCMCEGGSGYDDPIQIPTEEVDVYGIPLEYSIVDGNLTVLTRPDLYYYTQNAEQSWMNMVTGNVAKIIANGMGTYVTYQLVSKIPYIARLFDQ